MKDVSSADLSTALVDALRDAETSATTVVAEKYKALDAELSGILGGMQGGAALPPQE